MTRERVIRLFAGTIVLVSLALGHFVSPWWLLLTAFVGFNLAQSALTCFCPLDIMLKAGGVKSEAEKGAADGQPTGRPAGA